MTVAGAAAGCEELAAVVTRSEADALVLGMWGDDVRDVVEGVLAEHPRLKIVAMGGDGRRVCVYELRPHEIPVGEISPNELVDTIRSAVRGPAADTDRQRGPN